MGADPLEQILELVAQGRLSPDEAAPILAALNAAGPGSPPHGEPDGGQGPGPSSASTAGAARRPGGQGATTLRIEVRDRGRPVVNLRLPIAVGRFALDRVPGLSGDQVARVREALGSGQRGAVLEVDDDGDGVRIVLE